MHVCALCVYVHESVCLCVYSVLLELMGIWEQLDVNTITLRNYLSIASEILLSLDTCTCLVY